MAVSCPEVAISQAFLSSGSYINSTLCSTVFPEPQNVAVNSLFKAEDSTVFYTQHLEQLQVLAFTAKRRISH